MYTRKNVNIFKIYAVCVCLYIYIINIHSTHKYYVNYFFFLDAINRLTALIINQKDKWLLIISIYLKNVLNNTVMWITLALRQENVKKLSSAVI